MMIMVIFVSEDANLTPLPITHSFISNINRFFTITHKNCNKYESRLAGKGERGSSFAEYLISHKDLVTLHL